MSRMKDAKALSCYSSRATSLALLAICCFAFAACSSKPNTESPAAAATSSPGKHYAMKGRVLSVAKDEGSATVDADAIPGFMDAMAMPYPIPDQKVLATLAPGDEITADVVITPDGKYHLENVVVTKKTGAADAKPSSENLHQPQPGDKVPDFALVNQDGKKVDMDSFKGKVTLVTFIYTRCPFPDYCPLVSNNFAQIYAQARSNPALFSKLRLVSISFDPTHDTPKVLRAYGETFEKTTGGQPFDHWQFATAAPKELEKITNFFGVLYDPSQKDIVHSLSTSVIGPQGTIYKWYDDNSWKPSDLLGDATQALSHS
ncbi:MAG TPA: SCO family protein [Candidatus Acidoferrales bacterium]|jgi:protein SCO1/2|nr:SCO family protein [Candidatus Acidoferrales bacterium]